MNLTQHEHGFENSKYCSNHYAVLRGSKKVTIARRPDTNWTENKIKTGQNCRMTYAGRTNNVKQ